MSRRFPVRLAGPAGGAKRRGPETGRGTRACHPAAAKACARVRPPGREQAAGSTVSNNYWSSSTYQNNPNNAWNVNFNDGNVNNDNKTNTNYVRAVRGGSCRRP